MSTSQLGFSVWGNAETTFFDLVANSEEPNAVLQRFGIQYHYFSLHQIHAFCGVFRILKPKDRDTAAALAKVVYEELGEGHPRRVHSVILETFLREVGVEVSDLPLQKSEVVSGVAAYVDELYSAFWGQDRSVALATYCFLENSAVQTYPALEAILSQVGISPEGREFFQLHGGLEVEHAATAEKLAISSVTDPIEINRFNAQLKKLNQIWEQFWKDVTNFASTRR